MSDSKISALSSYTNPDRTNDSLPIVDNTNSTTKRISVNNLLGITSAPVGKDDTQTLTAKTLTAPTINGATLSGTLSGTYTIGGTPSFPASVVTLTGSQTLTNKILTSPTINAPTITNASITQDAVTGFTNANNGTLYGIAVTSSAFTTNNIVPNNSLSNTGSFGSAWAWTSYTPTLGFVGGGSIGTGTTTGAYTQIGKTVHFWATLILGSTTTFTSMTSMTCTLPVTANATWAANNLDGTFSGTMHVNGAQYQAVSYSLTTTLFTVCAVNVAGTYANAINITGTVPNSWAQNSANFWQISGTYQAT